jgi:hypothetical protein
MGQKIGKIVNTAGSFGSKILGGLNKARDFTKNVYGTVKKIPIIGNVVDALADTPIPYIGMSAKNIAGYVDKGIDVGNGIRDVVNSARMPRPPDYNARRQPLPAVPRR